MTTAVRLMSKLSRLTEDQQRDVLEYVEKLPDVAKVSLLNPHGSCADLRSDLPFDEFQKNREEISGEWAADSDRRRRAAD
jgi:cell division protein FtsX